MCPCDWGTIDGGHWWVRLRCGDCEVWTEIVITNAQASFLDCALDRQQQQIRRAAELWTPSAWPRTPTRSHERCTRT